ncbi:MAG: Uma2 family endonuclease [Pirellulales bacterium]
MTALSSFIPIVDTVPLPLRRFTADEFIAMAQSGAFDERHRVELIEGLVVDMSPSGSPHNHLLMNLTEVFAPIIQQFRLAVQATLRVNDSQVYDPDFMLLRRKANGYRDALPVPDNVELLIEVAESSWDRDSKVKLPVYATAGIADYWIVDIARELLIVHRSPEGNRYSDFRELRPGDIIVPLALPDFTLDVSRVFAS